MTTKNTSTPTKKLATIRKKMMALQQEETRICHDLSRELSKILIDAQALEIDFDVLVGGVLGVIAQAKTDTDKAKSWQQSGHKFLQNQSLRRHEKEYGLGK